MSNVIRVHFNKIAALPRHLASKHKRAAVTNLTKLAYDRGLSTAINAEYDYFCITSAEWKEDSVMLVAMHFNWQDAQDAYEQLAAADTYDRLYLYGRKIPAADKVVL